MKAMNLAFIRWIEILNSHSISEIAIYGAGDLGREGYSNLESAGMKIKFFIDQAAINKTFTVNDLPVIAPEFVVDNSIHAIVICSEKFATQIEGNLMSFYNNDEKRPLILTMSPISSVVKDNSFLWVDSAEFWCNKCSEKIGQTKSYKLCSELIDSKKG